MGGAGLNLLSMRCEMGYTRQCPKDAHHSKLYHDWLRETSRMPSGDETPRKQQCGKIGASGLVPVDSPLMRLPTELHLLIYKRLNYKEVAALRGTCHYFRQFLACGYGLKPRKPPSLREGALKSKRRGERVVTTYNIAILGYKVHDVEELVSTSPCSADSPMSRSDIVSSANY